MPKIIKNLEARLIAEAQKQIQEVGYNTMTVRSVAKACGVGLGTVYNYFPSKEHLLIAYLLQDMDSYIGAIQTVSESADTPLPVLRCIYDQLHQFNQSNTRYFSDEASIAAVASAFSRFHGLLRSQLAAPLRRFCGSDFEAEFIVEALITWSTSGKSFDEIYSMVGKLL